MKKLKAKNLQELAEELNQIDLDLEQNYEYPYNDPEAHYDATDLPTFGGEEPNDTEEIVSWDKDNILVHFNNWVIQKREEVA